MSAPKRQSLEFPSKDIAEVVPPPGYRERAGMPQPSSGPITPDRLRRGVAVFDSNGKVTQPNVPGAIPAPPRETITLQIVDVPVERMPPVAGGYNARFQPGVSSLISVPAPGLQPGESGPGSIPSKP